MDRLEAVRQVVDDILRQQPDEHESRCGFVHLYGVSAACVILALKRGLDPQLCAIAGMLHDISAYKTSPSPDHGPLSGVEAETILNEVGGFAPEEIALICDVISRHSAKGEVGGAMAELLKDADVLQHFLYNPSSTPIPGSRLEKVLGEIT